MSEQKLTIKYLPGVPEKFDKCFRVQVAHFEPDLITIHGEGVFPRISLDLPRVPDEQYTSLVKHAKENVYKRTMESFDNKLSPSISHPLGQHIAPDNLLLAQSQVRKINLCLNIHAVVLFVNISKCSFFYQKTIKFAT